MTDLARTRILGRLDQALATAPASQADIELPRDPPLDQARLIRDLAAHMTAVNAEIHEVPSDQWQTTLQAILREKRIGSLLYGPRGPLGETLEEAQQAPDWPDTRLVPYNQPMETLKSVIFEVDAGITGTAGAVADSGALILRTDAAEPRLISLVPPVHIAVLDAHAIYPGLVTAMQAMQWSREMPGNMLLISGPSKTADIEFTLAYGVHGPKTLCVIMRT